MKYTSSRMSWNSIFEWPMLATARPSTLPWIARWFRLTNRSHRAEKHLWNFPREDRTNSMTYLKWNNIRSWNQTCKTCQMLISNQFSTPRDMRPRHTASRRRSISPANRHFSAKHLRSRMWTIIGKQESATTSSISWVFKIRPNCKGYNRPPSHWASKRKSFFKSSRTRTLRIKETLSGMVLEVIVKISWLLMESARKKGRYTNHRLLVKFSQNDIS